MTLASAGEAPHCLPPRPLGAITALPAGTVVVMVCSCETVG